MYTFKNGKSQHIGANIQKSIKIDKETKEIIESVKGRSFSDKVRNMAEEYLRLKTKVLP
jgi:hypothetical protein